MKKYILTIAFLLPAALRAETQYAFDELVDQYQKAQNIPVNSISNREGYYLGVCFWREDIAINNSTLLLEVRPGQSLGPLYPAKESR